MSFPSPQLQFPASPSDEVMLFISQHADAALWVFLTMFFVPSRNEHFSLSLSYNPLCLALCYRTCACVFTVRSGWLCPPTLGLPWLSWYDKSAAIVITKHCIPKKDLIFLLPQLVLSLESPACTANLSLLLPSQSGLEWHPLTHPFMSVANEIQPGGTPFSQTLVFLSGLV